MAVHPAVGRSIQPKSPSGAPLGHADAGKHPWHPRPPGGDPTRDIRVKQEGLRQLRALPAEEFLQTPDDGRELPDLFRVQAMDGDASRFEAL